MKIVYLFCAILCFGGISMLGLPADDKSFIPIRRGSHPEKVHIHNPNTYTESSYNYLADYNNNSGSSRNMEDNSKSIDKKLGRNVTAIFGKDVKYSLVHFNITLEEIPRNLYVALENESSKGSIINKKTHKKTLGLSNYTKISHKSPDDTEEEKEEYGKKSSSRITYEYPIISLLQFNITLKKKPRNPLTVVETNSSEVSQKIEEINSKNYIHKSPGNSYEHLSNNTTPKQTEYYEREMSPQIVREYPETSLFLFNITLREIPRKLATTVVNKSSVASFVYSRTQKREIGLSNMTEDVYRSPEYSALDNSTEIEDFEDIQVFHKIPKLSSAYDITLEELLKKPVANVKNKSSHGSSIYDSIQGSTNVMNTPQLPEYSHNYNLESGNTMGEMKNYENNQPLASNLMSNETNGGNLHVWNLIPSNINYLEDAYDYTFDNKATMEKNIQSSNYSQFSNEADVAKIYAWDSIPENDQLLAGTLNNNIILDEVKNNMTVVEENEPNTVEDYSSSVIEAPLESKFLPQLSSDEKMFNLTVEPDDFEALVGVPDGSFLNSSGTERNCTDCTEAIEATTGMKLIACMCAIFTIEFPSESDIPLTSKTFHNISCHQDVLNEHACKDVCIDIATVNDELNDSMVCSFVESYKTDLKAFLYSKLCEDAEWNFTGISSAESVCCYRGFKIPC
nr:uncharacterized protein LOC111510870 isoform X2 [Leptinotarsa decemlineata]